MWLSLSRSLAPSHCGKSRCVGSRVVRACVLCVRVSSFLRKACPCGSPPLCPSGSTPNYRGLNLASTNGGDCRSPSRVQPIRLCRLAWMPNSHFFPRCSPNKQRQHAKCSNPREALLHNAVALTRALPARISPCKGFRRIGSVRGAACRTAADRLGGRARCILAELQPADISFLPPLVCLFGSSPSTSSPPSAPPRRSRPPRPHHPFLHLTPSPPATSP